MATWGLLARGGVDTLARPWMGRFLGQDVMEQVLLLQRINSCLLCGSVGSG